MLGTGGNATSGAILETNSDAARLVLIPALSAAVLNAAQESHAEGIATVSRWSIFAIEERSTRTRSGAPPRV